MSDQEIICTFMEPRPMFDETIGRTKSRLGWWEFHHREDRPDCYVCPRVLLDLNALWEVQNRLTDEQWAEYEDTICCSDAPRGYLHTTPEQKIQALAAVLRPPVEKES